ncbi:hypothetical protein pipiens_020340, partial [Culex pipiens pipiens]
MLDINLVWPGFYEGRPQNNGNGVGPGGDGDQQNGGGEEEDDADEGHESDGSENEMTEMWLLPSAPAIVDQIYSAMRECQALNPDPGTVSEDEDYMEAEEEDLQEVDEMRNLQLDGEIRGQVCRCRGVKQLEIRTSPLPPTENLHCKQNPGSFLRENNFLTTANNHLYLYCVSWAI